MVNTQRKRVCISILNWNNAPETVECIQSLGTPSDMDVEVIVLDNGGVDNATVWGDILTEVAHNRRIAGTPLREARKAMGYHQLQTREGA